MKTKLKSILHFMVLMLVLSTFSQIILAKTCDVDVDGDIDKKDIDLIMAARDKPANGSNDPRDADNDGKITVLDARKCSLQCSRPTCAINNAPVANNDSYSTNTNIQLTQAAPGVLKNDTDPEGNALTAVLVNPPANGALTLNPDGSFDYKPAANFSGDVTFTYQANDNPTHSNVATVTIKVNTVNKPPAVSIESVGTITLPELAHLTSKVTDDGLPTSPGTVTLLWSKVSGPGEVIFTFPTAEATTAKFSVAGSYVLRLTATDSALTTAKDVSVNVKPAVIGTGLPPDPATVAPALDPTVATNLTSATSFLYTGTNPIQTGVASGAINPMRTAVLRGKVLARDNTPLPGVKISLLNYPELGQTLSRADGMFDMVVNGGGVLTVNYEKNGYLPVQRQISAPWQDYAHLPNVVMIQLDTKVTPIDLNANKPIQVARGNLVSDKDGTRQATLLFAQGTTATVNGKALSKLNIRATEYTVGENGPKTMPAALPPSSGYTYAVELSADEALEQEVKFSKPVIKYVENFLSFPVGGIVPVGYYDRVKAAWVPSDNGRVIKILSIDGGMASIDTDGDGIADDADKLAVLGVTDVERQELATLYNADQSLWRVPITHFSPWDCNWPFGPPPDAKPPNVPEPEIDTTESEPDCQGGSIIECQNQLLRETVGIVSTPFDLNYRSDRVSGRKMANTINIKLLASDRISSLKRIDLEITAGGQKEVFNFPAELNQKFSYIFNNKDAYGRPIQGGTYATVRIGYVYEGVYLTPAPFERSFAAFSNTPITGNRMRMEITLWKETRHIIHTNYAEIGGWSLTPHHAYDPAKKVLYLGDGRRRSTQSINNMIITTIAGTGEQGFAGDGGKATAARLNNVWGVAVHPDGGILIADTGNHRIRRIGLDGIITTVAGTGERGFSGDGGPATAAQLYDPSGVAIGPDGSLFIADLDNHRIRRVGLDGIITTVAGTGTRGFSGDGGPATSAQLNNPKKIAVGQDGTLFIADSENHRVRRVGLDGIITTVVGNGFPQTGGDGGPAAAAQVGLPTGVAVKQDGTLLIATISCIRSIGVDGVISTVAGSCVRAGNWDIGFSGDGQPATEARLYTPSNIATGLNNDLFVADFNNIRIRRIDSDGIITTVAGTGVHGFSGDGGIAKNAQITPPTDVAVGQDGNFYIADYVNRRIRKVQSAMPGISATDIAISAEDSAELYIFTSDGRHLKTLHSLTGALLYQFGYDNANRLISITDGDGNVTTLERDTKGKPVAIVAPDGQRTTLALDANGYLASITNPAGESYQMSYTKEGLLTSFTNPRGNQTSIIYDSFGRLIKNQNAANGSWVLNRTEQRNEQASGYTVNMTSAENRTTIYQIENFTTGDQRRLNTAPDGTKTETLIKTDDTRIITAPDGTVTTKVQGPDPRFSMQAPITKNLSVKLPSGLSFLTAAERTVSLTKPDDPLSLKTETNKMTLNGKTFTTVYDATLKQHTVSTPLNRQATAKIDAQGRVIQRQVAGIDAINYSYDTRGRLISLSQGSGTAARAVTLSYNPQGYLASITDPLGRTQSYSYDAAGRVTQQTLPDGRIIKYAYDANGNVTSLTPPGRPAHAFAYTPVDLESQYKPPAVGLPTPQTRYAYNLDKQLTRITRPDGQLVNFAYDTGGRLSNLTTPTGETRYIYTATTGQLSTITAPDASLSYLYDGALPISEAWDGKIAGKVTRSYNNDLALSGLSINGVNIAYLYDGDGLLAQAGDLKLTRNVVNGLLTDTTLGAMTTHQNYNTFGELSQLIAKQSGASLLDIQYTRDKAGRITQQTEIIAGETIISTYAYDTAGRLVSTVKKGIPSTYRYDANGNRLSHDGVTGTYDAQDRLLTYGGNTYHYTDNGELKTRRIAGQTTAYTYDVRGNLTHVTLPDGTQIEYLIDGRNRRIGKKVNGVKSQGFLYQSTLRPAAELDSNDNVVSRFVYATRINVPEYMIKGGVTYRIITDHLGSPRLVVNTATGAIAQRIDYDAFGNITNDTNPGFQPFGFAGGLYDRDTKLVRFGARDYDAETGRWTAKDPIGFGARMTNLYGYAANDPINNYDPMGKDWRKNVKLILTILQISSGLYKPFDPTIQKPPISEIPDDAEERHRKEREKKKGSKQQKGEECGAGPDPDPIPDSSAFPDPKPEEPGEIDPDAAAKAAAVTLGVGTGLVVAAEIAEAMVGLIMIMGMLIGG